MVAHFWAGVDIGEPDDCWEWQRSRRRLGYGHVNPQVYGDASAHRIAWQFTNGPIPADLWVLHRCDNPPCCNPAHLFLGTALDNAQDRDSKGRRSAPTTPRDEAGRWVGAGWR